tara:strand:- start:130 stop:384 length:255 start_codon:yes stop_codon:yes gene_type:complete
MKEDLKVTPPKEEVLVLKVTMSRPTPPALMLLAGTYKHPHKGFWSHYIHDEGGVKQISFRQEHVTAKELFAYIKYEEARNECGY